MNATPAPVPTAAQGPARRRRRTRAAAVTLLSALVVGAGASAAHAANGFGFDIRIGGNSRVDTAVQTSQQLYPAGGQDDVVIVNAGSVVDGLSASYLAGLKNAPILLAGHDELPSATSAEIKRLGATHIWLVGGEGVLSAGLAHDLSDHFTVKRFGGHNRYDTAAQVAEAAPYEPERVYITSGVSLADAVTVSPISWARNYPVLLTKSDSVPEETKAALVKLGTPERTVVGGFAAVSKDTGDVLGATSRLAGSDRQGTAVAVAEDAVATAGFTASNAALVGGSNGNAIDALVAGPLAGNTGTPLLYIKGNDDLGSTTAEYLGKHKADLSPANNSLGFVIGGTGAVPQHVVDQANTAAR